MVKCNERAPSFIPLKSYFSLTLIIKFLFLSLFSLSFFAQHYCEECSPEKKMKNQGLQLKRHVPNQNFGHDSVRTLLKSYKIKPKKKK